MNIKLKIIFASVLLVFVSLLGFNLKKGEAAINATFALSPASGSYKVGDTFNVNVVLDTAGNETDGAAVRCVRYDTSLLSVQGVTVGSLYSNTQTNTTSSATCSQIEVSQVNTGGATYNGSGNFITISFSVLAAGTANITIDHTLGNTTDSNIVGIEGDLLSTVTNASFTLTVPVDSTAPVISSVSSSGITTSGATVTWATNEASTSQVDYGTTSGYGSSTSLDSTMVTGHSVALSGLSSGTTYHYQVKSQDAAGNLAISSDGTFVTVTPADTTPPVISNVRVVAKDSSAVVIAWDTDEASDSRIEYGASSNYGGSTGSGDLVTSHQMSIGGLSASTTYHYRVISGDAAGNIASSLDATVTTDNAGGPPIDIPVDPPTADTTAPAAIKDLLVSDMGDTTVVLTWIASGDDETSGTAASYEMHYSTANITDGNWSKSDKVGGVMKPAGSGLKETLVVKSLKPSTKYYFAIKVSDEVPNTSGLSNVVIATTKEAGASDTTAPAKVENFSATAGTSKKEITLNWVNPVDSDFIKVILIRKSGGEPLNQSDGVIVYEGQGSSFVDTGVISGATYYYKIFALDEVSNYSEGSVVSATLEKTIIVDTTPPKSVSKLKTNFEDGNVVISWTNPSDSDFAGVVIRRKGDITPKNQDDGSLIYQGPAQTFTDQDIEKGKTYYYAVFAVDKSSNYSKAISAVVVAESSGVGLALGIVIASVLVLGGSGYWWFFYRSKPDTSILKNTFEKKDDQSNTKDQASDDNSPTDL